VPRSGSSRLRYLVPSPVRCRPREPMPSTRCGRGFDGSQSFGLVRRMRQPGSIDLDLVAADSSGTARVTHTGGQAAPDPIANAKRSGPAPEEFADRLAADIELWAPLTKEADNVSDVHLRATRSNFNVRFAPRAVRQDGHSIEIRTYFIAIMLRSPLSDAAVSREVSSWTRNGSPGGRR
jgi:hypothetical protein